jgi:hypothetical protein
MRSPRTTAVATAAALTALLLPMPVTHAGTTAGTAPAGPTRVISDCVHTRVKPHKIVSACGDGNEWAFIKDYGSWGRKQAWGHGRLHLNDCDPSCAEGTMRSYQATFRLHRVVRTEEHGRLFTRLGVTYLKGGEQHNVELALPRRPLS